MVTSLVACLDIGPVFHMNGRVQELLWWHTVNSDQSGPTVSLSRCITEKWIGETSLDSFQCLSHFKILSSRTYMQHFIRRCSLQNFRDASWCQQHISSSDRGGGVDRLWFPEVPKWFIIFRINGWFASVQHIPQNLSTIRLRRGWRGRRLCVDGHRDSKMVKVYHFFTCYATNEGYWYSWIWYFHCTTICSFFLCEHNAEL